MRASNFVDGMKSYGLLEWCLRSGRSPPDLMMCHSPPFSAGVAATILVPLPSLMNFSMSATEVSGSSSHSSSRLRKVSLGSSLMPESTASSIVWGSCFGVSKEKGSPRGLSNVVNGLPWAVPGGSGALSNSNQGGEGGGLPVEGLFVLGLVTGCFFFFLVVTIVGEGCSSASELSSGDALGSLRILLCAGESLPLVA